jgi:hypothetical protein
MEIPTELQQSLSKANQAVEKAQSDYDNMLVKVSNLEAEYTKAFIQINQTVSFVDIDQYLKTTLKTDCSGEAKPCSGEAKPCSGEAKPCSGEAKPSRVS